jgi:hypothetical protein
MIDYMTRIPKPVITLPKAFYRMSLGQLFQFFLNGAVLLNRLVVQAASADL